MAVEVSNSTKVFVWSTPPDVVENNTEEFSGFLSTFSTRTYNNATQQELDCDVGHMPSRIVLQVFNVMTLLLNLAAAVVVFSVSMQVRGQHVSFLFGCVRILNLLDIMQCTILIFFPFIVPTDCHPNIVVCDITGYLFAAVTFFSPLVAIVMAVDRGVAVYFHVSYKTKLNTKIKYSFLCGIFGIYGVYLLLPCFTNFGAYVAVPWLSLCSLEWGKTHRTYVLILISVSTFLVGILIAANVAVLVKIRFRKKQVEKLKRRKSTRHSKTSKSAGSNPTSAHMKRRNRSADDSIDISSDECTSFIQSQTRATSLSKKNSKKRKPPPLILTDRINDEASLDHSNRQKLSVSPLTKTVYSNINSSLTPPLTRAKPGVAKARPLSSVIPAASALHLSPLSPLSISTSNIRPPSPLVLSSDEANSVKIRSMPRSSSADNLLSSPNYASANKFSFTKPQTPTLLRQVLDSPVVKTCDKDGLSIGTRSSGDESDSSYFRPVLSSTSSFFSFAFASAREASVRLKRKRKGMKMRKSVSRITKMTLSICLVFIILYLPFLTRKLVQLIPDGYKTLPTELEIATLFGPLLSPFCNPLVYVFLNPHYKSNCIKIIRKLKKKILHCFQTSPTNSKPQRSLKKKKKPNNERFSTQHQISPTDRQTTSNHSLEDVFLSDNKDDKKSRNKPMSEKKKLKQKKLWIKKLQNKSQ